MTRTRIGLAGVALTAMAMIGCGASSATTPAGQTPIPATAAAATPVVNTGERIVPCDTLRPQVQAIVGGTFFTGEGEDTDTDTDCSYTFVDPPSGLPSGGVVNVRLEPSDYDTDKEFLEGVDVPGVGDRAFWSDRFGVLYADYRGANWVVQIVVNGNITDRQGVATQVMQALFDTM